jgi:hypothetical protein
MQLHKRLLKSVFGRAALAAIALGGSLFFCGCAERASRAGLCVSAPGGEI